MPFATLAQVFILAGLLWAACFLLRRGKGAAAAVCAHCAFPTGDVTRLRCPECGQDLRVVGIVSPRMRARMAGSYAGVAVGWTLLVLTLGGLAASLLATVLPAEVVQVGTTTFQPVPAAVAPPPLGVAPLTIVVRETLSRPEPRGARSVSMIEWTADNRRTCVVEALTPTSRVRIDVTDRAVDLGAGPVPLEKIERGDVADALAAAGIGPIHAALLDDFTRALGEADTALVTRTLSQSASVLTTGGTTTARSRPAWGAPGAVAAGGALLSLWAWGLVVLARRMRLGSVEEGVAS